MGKTVEMLTLAGLRCCYPDDSPAQRQRRLADTLLGPALPGSAYGPPQEES